MKVLSVQEAVELINHEYEEVGKHKIRFDLRLTSGETLTEKAHLDDFGIDKIYKAFDLNKTNQLHFRIRKHEGAAWKHGEDHLLQIKPTPIPMEVSVSKQAAPTADPTYVHLMISLKDDKIAEMQRSISLLENGLRASEKEATELKQKNMELERENKLKDSQFDLEKRNWEVNREREDFKKESTGMNGFVGGAERLLGNPAALKMIEMIMMRGQHQPAQLGVAQEEGSSHTTPMIRNFAQFVNSLPDDKAQQFFQLVVALSNQPSGTWSDVQSLLHNQAA